MQGSTTETHREASNAAVVTSSTDRPQLSFRLSRRRNFVMAGKRLLQCPMVFDTVHHRRQGLTTSTQFRDIAFYFTSAQLVSLLRTRSFLLSPAIFVLSYGVSARMSLSLRPSDAPLLVALQTAGGVEMPEYCSLAKLT
jgi:hypothetical protein